jgi:hypothetical protein
VLESIQFGYKAKYTSKSIVYHVGGATLNEGNPKKTFLNFRNSLLMLTKNLPKNQIVFNHFYTINFRWISWNSIYFERKIQTLFCNYKSTFFFLSFDFQKFKEKKYCSKGKLFSYKKYRLLVILSKKMARFLRAIINNTLKKFRLNNL